MIFCSKLQRLAVSMLLRLASTPMGGKTLKELGYWIVGLAALAMLAARAGMPGGA